LELAPAPEKAKPSFDKAKDRGEDYFAARQMLGEFYYNAKDPVAAYENLKFALAAYDNPAEFTNEDFYIETEHIGKSYALMGNIFYYFFEKVRFDFGDQESLSPDELEMNEKKMENFIIARQRYESAIKRGYKSPELYYNLGRIEYLDKNYEDALYNWLNLYEGFTASPELMFALGNVFYKLNNNDSAKAQYMKLIDIYELEASKITNVKPKNPQHIKIFQSLSSVYNNIGVVYQVEGDEAKSSISYWKSIEHAKSIEQENEFARVNIGRSLKERQYSIIPVLDDNIPYSIEYYRESMR
jgi:tetratricopeptide (TPR) repeat protein